MHAEDLAFDHSCQGQIVKQIREHRPYTLAPKLFCAFIVKSIDLGNPSRLMVAASEGDPLGVSDFEADQQSHGLDGVVSTVDIIS